MTRIIIFLSVYAAVLLTASHGPTLGQTASDEAQPRLWSAPLGSQDVATSPEQNVVLKSPLAGETSASGEASGADVLLKLCANSEASRAVAEACEAAIVELISSQAKRTIQENAIAVAAIENSRAHDAENRALVVAALQNQAWRSGVIFWVAMGVVALGLIAATLQFRMVWREGTDGTTPTEISVSEKSLTIKTAWIGVVLMAMSMGFLALYLTQVYQIEPL